MRRSAFILWLDRLAWGIITGDLALVWLLPERITSQMMLLVIASLFWLLISLLAVTTWLMVRHYKFFSTWIGWSLPVVLLAFSNLTTSGVWKIENTRFALLFSLLGLLSAWVVGVGTAILLWHRDESLMLLGVLSAGMVWILAFAWRFQGNLIEHFFSAIGNPDQLAPFWWLNVLICVSWWVVPLGGLSFLWHTGHIVYKELKQG